MTIYFFSKPFFLKQSVSSTNREYPLRPHAAISTPYPIRTSYFCINIFTSSLNEILNCFFNSDILSSVHPTVTRTFSRFSTINLSKSSNILSTSLSHFLSNLQYITKFFTEKCLGLRYFTPASISSYFS